MSPLSVLRMWVIGLLSLLIVGTAAYLAWDWYRYNRDDEQLYWAIGIALLSFAGRFAIMPIFGLGGQPPKLNVLEQRQVKSPDGTTINVNTLRRGDGPVVVLLHGWSLDSSVWAYVQEELPASCEILAPDLRGLGDSSKSPKNDYSIETMAGDFASSYQACRQSPSNTRRT